MPTLRGSRTVDPAQPWDVDAPVAARLREAGAVILGKTATPEFGCKGETNSPLTGITRNPWNPRANAGRLVGRHGGGDRRRHGAALGRHRRRRQRPHPGGVLRQLRPEAELRPRAGVSALALRQRRPPRPARTQRRRRGADDERDQAARRARLDLAAARPERLHASASTPASAACASPGRRRSATPGTCTPRSPPRSLRPRSRRWRRSVPMSSASIPASTIRSTSPPASGSPAPGRSGTG